MNALDLLGLIPATLLSSRGVAAVLALVLIDLLMWWDQRNDA